MPTRSTGPSSGRMTGRCTFTTRPTRSAAGTILIVGPAGAKTELANHLAAHAPGLSTRVAGVETVDHPSEGELLALARQFFQASDRMHSVA